MLVSACTRRGLAGRIRVTIVVGRAEWPCLFSYVCLVWYAIPLCIWSFLWTRRKLASLQRLQPRLYANA
ncbi:unnamed protein product [Fusarium fujikuroi]|nr:unnamed protein product [Fusarium fujikuroi]